MEYKFTTDNFEAEVLQASTPVLVDFFADWCGPCKMMSPIMAQIAGENMDTIKVCKLNIDENTSTAMKYRVLSIPTLVFFKGGVMLGRIEGAVPKSNVDQKIRKYFG